jgi:hypothetical protein
MILKYRYLDKEKQMVKLLSEGKYGIYDLVQENVVVAPVFDSLQYHKEDDVIWAKQNGYYFRIDHNGNMEDDERIVESDWLYIDKNDRCPSCNGKGCVDCFGFGSVPIGGDYNHYFDDWD